MYEFKGFNGLLGMRVTEWSTGVVTLELPLRAELHNRSGVTHGGVVASLIDAAGGLAGGYTGNSGELRPSVTLSLTTTYLNPSSTGTLRAVARRRGGGRRIFSATVEVFDDSETLIAVGEATYRHTDRKPD